MTSYEKPTERTFIREIPLDKFTKEQEAYYVKNGNEIELSDHDTVLIWAK